MAMRVEVSDEQAIGIMWWVDGGVGGDVGLSEVQHFSRTS